MKTAFPNLRSPVQITLYNNIPFDNTYKHHSLISDRFTYNGTPIYTNGSLVANIPPKERFIDRRNPDNVDEYYYPRWVMSGEFNFNYSNGLVTSVTLELTPAQTNANYMKVKCGNDIYYYFINSINQINYDTYVLTLELDVLMTYQDEFLDGVKGMPIFTTRKHSHRFGSDNVTPLCCDYKSGEDAFSGIKPTELKRKIDLEYSNTSLKNIKNVIWLYVCTDCMEYDGARYGDFLYRNKNIAYPLTMLCIPINVDGLLITDGTNTYDFGKTTSGSVLPSLRDEIRRLINSGVVHGAKISNYPPFNTGNITLTNAGTNSVLTINVSSITSFSTLTGYKTMKVGYNQLAFVNRMDTGLQQTNLSGFFIGGFVCITNQEDSDYYYSSIKLFDSLPQPPSPLMPRVDDPKLNFSPFKKYVLGAKYTSQGVEIYPELLYSSGNVSSGTSPYQFATYTTCYIGDNNIFTYLRPYYIYESSKQYTYYLNYKYEKIGLASSMNYIMPVGTDALDVFNATQSQSFYTSKVASGISSGLAIAGGVASMVIGAGMVVTSGEHAGTLTPAGSAMIASGASAISGGVASGVNAIKSANAKIEDLKNTPESINISGSNFITDSVIVENPIPYIIVYDCVPVIKENANDYFYQYGYQVARDCYFNTELKYVPACEKVDNDLFGRTLFNYIKTNEDLVNKINSDIPIIVKKKLSSIFNDGITLWSIFGFPELWGNALVPSFSVTIDDYFLKHDYDNTEFNILMGI